MLTKPFPVPKPPHNSLRDINFKQEHHFREPPLGYMYPQQCPEKSVPRSECMSRKTYSNFHKITCPVTSPFDMKKRVNYFEPPFPVYDPDSSYENTYSYEHEYRNHRQRALSFSDTPHVPQLRKTSKSVRDRNRRRQSYNPRVYDSSSSDTECGSFDSVDWRRRRRLSSLSMSNNSIRSEINRRPNYLHPEFAGSVKGLLGRSPPPSSTILSGLSPTTAARYPTHSDSSSSSSDL